jgi:hypothetical protein
MTTPRKERLVLDPAEVATGGRAELDLHSGAVQVREGGIDWGQAEIEAFMAQHELGESPVDYRLPNRVITIPLVLGAEGDFDAARITLQAKVSRINEEGGWLKRELLGGSYGEAGARLYCDLVKATLRYGGSTLVASNGVDPDAELVLEALPDFYGDPVEAPLFEGTGDATSTLQVKGNLPGRVDLAVYEESGNDQRGLAWGFRCRNYSSASSARLAYSAEALHPLDQASVVSLTGAYGGKAIGHTNLSTGWTPVLDNTMSGVYPTHVGLYDVWARVYTSSPEPPWVRLVHDVGDLIDPTENDPVRVPGASSFYLVNLGQVNLREAPIGPHRWIGVVQGRGASAGARLYVDRLWYLPADEGSGIIRAASSYEVGIGGFKVRDRFAEREGASLTGRTADYGGVYTALTGSDTDDFQVSLGSRITYRSTASDTGTMAGGWKGRAVGLPVGMTATAFAYDFAISGEPTNLRFGQMVRVGGSSQYLLFYFAPEWQINLEEWRWYPRVFKQVGETGGLIYALNSPIFDLTSGTEFKGRLLTMVVGDQLTVLLAPFGTSSYEVVLRQRDVDLGGTLSAGGIYIFDEVRGPGTSKRSFSNLAAWVPDSDAVLFANRDARLTSRGLLREAAAGSVFGEAAYPRSDLPRIPFSGDEARPVETILKPTRGDLEVLADTGIDNVAARLTYRPCWTNIPE